MNNTVIVTALALTLLFVLWPRRRPDGGVTLGVAWFVVLAIAVVAAVATTLLTPKPKGPDKPKASDLQDPTNDAGREIGVLFGECVIKDGNFLWFGEKSVRTYKIAA